MSSGMRNHRQPIKPLEITPVDAIDPYISTSSAYVKVQLLTIHPNFSRFETCTVTDSTRDYTTATNLCTIGALLGGSPNNTRQKKSAGLTVRPNCRISHSTTTTTTTTNTGLKTQKRSLLILIGIRTMASSNGVLNRITPDQVSLEIKDPVDPTALQQAKAILEELTNEKGMVNADSLLQVGKRFGDISKDASTFVISKEECKAAYDGLSESERTALTNIHGRVKAFAEMQRKSVVDMEMDIPGGKAGHTVSPCKGQLIPCK